MAYIVTDNCKDCMFTQCVSVCPVDCFYGDSEKDKMIYIHPEECIDCGACVPECPVEAIFPEEEVPENMQQYIQINSDRSQASDITQITSETDSLPTAEEKKKALGF
ncbi:ferredoxin family protein [candidate division TA06 bacterium]|nr:ferredoxin family protein [candidate division TA06 bacterium]